MESHRRWVPLGFLAIIIPVGLIVGFRFGGILTEPVTSPAVTMTAETVYFRMERPNIYAIHPLHWIHNHFESSELVADFNIYVHAYYNDSNFGGSSEIVMNITMNVSVSQGFIRSILFTFRENYSDSFFDAPGGSPNSDYYSPLYYVLQNLTVQDCACFGNDWWELKNNTKAFMEAFGVGRPDRTYFNTVGEWFLQSSLSQHHLLEASASLIYWNASVYKRLILPINLVLQPDSHSADDATVLVPGAYIGCSNIERDREDWYKIWLETNARLGLRIAYEPEDQTEQHSVPQVDMFIYNSDLYLKVYSFYNGNATGRIGFTTDTAGWWMIQVKRHFDEPNDHDYTSYPYVLSVSVSSGG